MPASSEKDAAELSDQLRQKGIEIVTADGEDQRAARGIGGAVGKQVGKEKVKGCGRQYERTAERSGTVPTQMKERKQADQSKGENERLLVKAERKHKDRQPQEQSQAASVKKALKKPDGQGTEKHAADNSGGGAQPVGTLHAQWKQCIHDEKEKSCGKVPRKHLTEQESGSRPQRGNQSYGEDHDRPETAPEKHIQDAGQADVPRAVPAGESAGGALPTGRNYDIVYNRRAADNIESRKRYT